MTPQAGITRSCWRRRTGRTCALAATVLLQLLLTTAMATEVRNITFEEAVQIAREEGLWRFDTRRRATRMSV